MNDVKERFETGSAENGAARPARGSAGPDGPQRAQTETDVTPEAALWNRLHRQYDRGTLAHDGFLDRYTDVIEKTALPVIDLGCGTGNNALWLREHGKAVVACDYSETALALLCAYLPEVQTVCCDLAAPLPFPDASADVVVSDMSLHFFDAGTTRRLIAEIARILRPNGRLLLRCNHIEDFVPSEDAERLEADFYRAEGLRMRYFTQDALLGFFAGWRVCALRAEQMTRYTPARRVWCACLERP